MSTNDPNDSDDEIQGLTVGLVEQAFRHSFPGANYKVKDRLGGKVLTADIWQFHVELSVTERPITYADTDGEATVSVTFQPDKKKSKGHIVHQESTTSPSRVWTLVKDTRKYLEGIAAAISMACEENYERDINSIRELFE